jgi:hypothetical protein
MSEAEKPTAAFILSLIGGIFILLGGGMMTLMGWAGFCGITGCRSYGGMMGPGFGMIGNGYAYGYSGMFGFAGILFGAGVIIGALMLYNNPFRHSNWGLVILIFSLLSMFGSSMGGFGIGLALGLIGGILAITWKPTETEERTGATIES